jgi:hypothetical protein
MSLDAAELETGKSADSTPKVRANGKAKLLTLSDIDARTRAHRETRKLIEAIELDLGGADRLSTGERQLVQRAAVLGALLCDTESRWIDGEPIDPTTYCTTINAQCRLLEVLGLSRRPRDVSQDLSSYLAAHQPVASPQGGAGVDCLHAERLPGVAQDSVDAGAMAPEASDSNQSTSTPARPLNGASHD